MTDRRGGLGRGLGALIPRGPREVDDRPADVFFPHPVPSDGRHAGLAAAEVPPVPAASDVPRGTSSDGVGSRPDVALVPVDGVTFAELPLARIVPNPRQPRQVFDPDDLAELTASIRAVGLLQPVVVRPAGEHYELVMGERRWRAAALAELTTVPALVRSTADDAMLRDALLENLHRTALNPLEEAAAYQQLLDDFGCTHDELGARIGRSRPQVSNTLRLLKLPPPVQRRVAAGVLSAGHARALLGLDDADQQERLATRIVAEGLSVRAVEEVVALGGDPTDAARPTRPRGRRLVAPHLADLAASLSERLETRVTVDLGVRKGKVVVEFATLDDLERIVAVIDPDLRSAPGPVTAAAG